MIPGGVNELLLRSAGAAGPTAGRSVRFNAPDSAYLSRTPASAGNRRTFTWSGWLKRSAFKDQDVFSAQSSTAYFTFRLQSDNTLRVNHRTIGVGDQILYISSQVFRDPSSWYHFVIAVDTTQATSTDRIKVYVNNTQITAWSTSTAPSQNLDTVFNTANTHFIGGTGSGTFAGQYLNGYLALVHMVDGQALTPSSFGETSATTGQWIAKTYSGSYGTNGFFLDFADNSTAAALGYDAAGSNDWTVNNIIVGPTTTTNDSWSGYFDGNGDYLTLSSNASMSFGTGTFTIEGWFLTTDKSLSVGAGRTLIGNSGNSYTSQLYITTNGYITFGNTGSTFLQGSTNLADASWHHVAVSRSGTGSNQIAMWVDGTRVALGTNAENYTSGTIYIGAFDTANGYWNGYISNLRIVKGSSVYDPSNSTITVPTSPLTAITNTALLICKSSTFVDNSANAYTVTANGNARVSRDGPFEIFSDSDSLRDHPTSAGSSTGVGGEVSGNYCTWNPLKTKNFTLSDGNLRALASNTTTNSVVGTIGVSSSKWYWEVVMVGGSDPLIGICKDGINLDNYPGGDANGWGYYSNGNKYTNSTAASYGASYTTNDVIGVALDMDAGTVTFYKNGVSQGQAYSGLTGTIFPAVGDGGNIVAPDMVANFGQRAFAYTAPSGFSPLVDTLLPTPTIAKPNTVMDVVTYTGTGSSLTPTSTLGFNPDLIWIKSRSAATDHALYDAVRGAQARLESNTADAEATSDNGVTAFNSAGFTVGTLAQVNTSSATYAAWTWDAGSSNATNTSGTITSTVRANISAGFSVVTYTGTGSNATVGHGLGVAPQWIIVKRRDTTGNWATWHTSIANTNYLLLNSTAASTSGTTYWNSTSPTSSLFSIGTATDTNANGGTYVAYCWTPVANYSAMGSYTGNGSSDGPFVYTGFRPRWVMVKCTTASTTQDWVIMDAARRTYNAIGPLLYPNASSAEDTADVIDFTSNGFKIRATFGNYNTNTNNYIYAAFAEAPFPYSRAR